MEKKVRIPRQMKSQLAKEKILTAAFALIKEHGYEYLTVSGICDTAGVSVGCFYHHFRNKEDLLAHHNAAIYSQYQRQFEENITEDIIETIVTNNAVFNQYSQERGLAFMRALLNPSNKGLYARHRPIPDTEGTLPIMAKNLEELTKAQERGHIWPDADLAEIAHDVYSLAKGCVFEWCISDGTVDLQALSRRIFSRYLEAVVTPEYFKLFGKKT